ncbi:hypothetical protein [Streptomyces boncukensis]|uniref:Uncharacterized protein n=1 Tax=Streptomyces boncukensis TaxID=2711219 RepID=A0A6G4X512_9ACTN|nr:hypothetical protein [Streptomyces boncukensis]NGO71824.1 hypothetical protein [Streptomyces boncukensis]
MSTPPRPRRLSVAERLAAAGRDATLADLISRTSEWDRLLVEQAVYAVGRAHAELSANSLRELLPELAHGHLGVAIKALERGGIIEPTGQWVPSTSAATKGHRIAVWRLTPRGRRLASAQQLPPQRTPRSREQARRPAQLDLFGAA